MEQIVASIPRRRMGVLLLRSSSVLIGPFLPLCEVLPSLNSSIKFWNNLCVCASLTAFSTLEGVHSVASMEKERLIASLT